MSYGYPSAPPDLPYPWISQFDSNYQTPFFVNTQTGETTWTQPVPDNPQQSRSMSGAGYGGYDAYAQTPAASSYASAPSGEAASFYGDNSTAPNGGASPYQPSPQGPMSEPLEGGENGERGIGKVVVAGGALWLAHKLYKDWQKGKLSSHQQSQQSLLRPPQFAPTQPLPQQGGYGQQWAGRSQAFDPNQVYSQPAVQQAWQSSSTADIGRDPHDQNKAEYGRPPAYGSGAYSEAVTYQYQDNIPPPSFNGQPLAAQGTAYGPPDSTYSDSPSFASPAPASWQQPPAHGPGGWGDPRY